MDLTQAEAVIDLIEAETPLAAQNAAGQLRGAVGLKLSKVYTVLVDIMAHFHAVLDYPDEDIEEFRMQCYIKSLQSAQEELKRLLASHERGRIMRNGIPTVIIGRPNTGKSSLLNALLGYNRAIVTDIAGTTRDTVEEKALIGDILLRLIDTAGLHKTDETIEKLGVERTLEALQSAGLVLVVLDGSEDLTDEDYAVLDMLPPQVPTIIIVNKSDLLKKDPSLSLRMTTDIQNIKLSTLNHPGTSVPPLHRGEYKHSTLNSQLSTLNISALTGEGLDRLEAEIIKLFPEQNTPATGEVITNTRQFEAISRANEAIAEAIAAIESKITPDAILTEIEDALYAIGEVTGKTMREDIITRIFERFCVGK
jgi:tRNA modification GTPase